jgi:hypothetical protein
MQRRRQVNDGVEQLFQAIKERHDAHWAVAPPNPLDDERVVTDPTTGGRKGQKLAQFSQIPPDVLWELAEHFGKGLAKYPDDEAGKPNWQRGYSWRLSVDAMERHFNAWQRGEDEDPETGSSHLVCAIWHLMVLRWFQLHNAGTDYR